MAQVQKKDVRDRIIQAAKIEFYRAGYEGSNMRNIASGASITVGNLYRYFESKEYLYQEVIGKVYSLVNTTIESISEMNISMNKEMDPAVVMSLGYAAEHNYVRRIIDEIIRLFSEDRLSMLILLKDERGNEAANMKYSFVEWIGGALKKNRVDSDVSLYLAYSFVEGIIRIGQDFDTNEEVCDRIEEYVKFFFLRG